MYMRALQCSLLRVRMRPQAVAPLLPVARTRSWGSISNSSFGPNEAVVACRTLLFPDPSRAAVDTSYSYYSSGSMWIRELSCTGQEPRLRDCKITWCNESCPIGGTAAVRCE